MTASPESVPPLEIPTEALGAETLTAIIESFVLHEGTDYGATEVSLTTKIQQVRTQIDKGDVKIVFDGDSDSVTLMTKSEFLKRLHGRT